MTDTNISDVNVPEVEPTGEKKPANKKKIIIIIVAAVLAAALIAVGVILALNNFSDNPVKSVMEMYSNSVPTKVTGKTTQTFGEITLNSTYTLTTGFIGNKNAAVYEEKYQDMRSVEEGGESTVVYGHIADHHNLFHYIEGIGTRQVNPVTGIVISDWDINGRVFSVNQEGMTLALSNSRIKDENYKDNTLTCVVPADKTAAVFGTDLGADAQLKIVDNGAQIVSVHIEYVVPANGSVQETTIVIDIEYTYDNERINID